MTLLFTFCNALIVLYLGVHLGPSLRQAAGTHPQRPQTVDHMVVMATTTHVQNVLILCNILKKLLNFTYRNPECRSVASASKDGTVRIWDTMLFKTTLVLSGHTHCVTCVRWGGEGLIYTSSQDRTIKVWRAKDVSGLNFDPGVH